MEDNFALEPQDDIFVPEVCMNIDDAPIELNQDETEHNNGLPQEEQNGDVIELDEEGSISNHTSGEVNLDVIDANQENEIPAQIPEVYTLEEMTVHQQIFGPGQQAVQFLRIHCTACNVHLGSAPNMQYKRYIHPLLKVIVCKQCYEFYGSGDFDKDEDGSELYCRWCGQGGKVLCCAQCPFVFCQRCIRSNLGKKTLDMVKESDDWTCFACKPTQIINLRVTSRALYDFVQEEIRVASELKQSGRISTDLSMCCHTKSKSTPSAKRKRSDSAEKPYDPFINTDDTSRKKKKIKMNILSHMSAVTNENRPTKMYSASKTPAPKVWESQVEDEVVCTPDLSMLMDDDESTVRTPAASPQPSCSSLLQTVPPPLTPISPYAKTNSGVELGKDSDIQYIGQTKVISNSKSSKLLGYKLPGVPVVLNTSTNKPLTTTNIRSNITPNLIHLQAPAVRFSKNEKTARQPVVTVAHNRNNSIIDATPARLAPGLKYEWFEKAAQVTARVNQNLSTRLCSLSKDQSTVSSLEGLASIHNNLQEILSNSINSLMQIRKNLRSDFIAGLKKLKFCKTQENNSQSQTLSDDNDVIIVDSHIPNSDVPTNTNNLNENKKHGYIKVKPASELLDSSVITIPDDNVTTSDSIVIPSSDDADFLKDNSNIAPADENDNINMPPVDTNDSINTNDSLSVNTQNDQNSSVGNDPPASNYINANDALSEIEMSEVLNPETVILIKRAVLESKFESIVNDNLKITVNNIPPETVKRMLSVRTIIETNFGSATPKTRPYKCYKAMNIVSFEEQDFEQMLSSSTIVINTSKLKAFDDSFSDFVANATQRSNEDEEDIASESRLSDGDDSDHEAEHLLTDSYDKVDELVERDNSEKVNYPSVTESEETSPDPQNTDSGIDVDGEQSLSNGITNCHDNE